MTCMADPPSAHFVTTMEDSRRWRNVVRRPGDIVISTPPKSGTTWMQGIVHSLLWPDGDAPGSRAELSVWVDNRTRSIADLVEHYESQSHRRFMKTHSPGDSIPFDQRCRYIVVYRDCRDAFVSWGNHRSQMLPHAVREMNEAAAKEGVDPIAEVWDGDYDSLWPEWQAYCSPVRHLRGWWGRRDQSNVLFVHYNDLSHDLEAEMRRIADFLDLEIAETLWPQAVARCRLEAMREEARVQGRLTLGFRDGADAFFYKGTNNRWIDLLTPQQIERCVRHSDELEPAAANWLERGSIEVGRRPGAEAVDADDPAPGNPNKRPHPIFDRVGRRPSNSIDAISERAVEQARRDGLFDDLALHGKPIPDIDRQRPSGWWANQFVAKERSKVKAMQLDDQIRSAMPALWRLTDEPLVRSRVRELNDLIKRYNAATTVAPREPLDEPTTVATWRRLRSEK